MTVEAVKPDGIKKSELVFEQRQPGFYLPGDPRITNYREKFWKIADIVAGLPPDERPRLMYLSASDYGRLVAELRAQCDAPANEDPGYLMFGKKDPFLVANAGTDDEAEVIRLNRESPGAVDFEDRTKRFVKQ